MADVFERRPQPAAIRRSGTHLPDTCERQFTAALGASISLTYYSSGASLTPLPPRPDRLYKVPLTCGRRFNIGSSSAERGYFMPFRDKIFSRAC